MVQALVLCSCLFRRVEEEVALTVVSLDTAEAPATVLPDDEDVVVVLAEAAAVAHTHQGHPQPRGLAVHYRLEVLADSARGLVQHSQPRAVVEQPAPGQPLLLTRGQL